MTNLKEINFGINQFCGPAVMSALTGKSTDECAAVISAVSGRQEIRAVAIAHLIEAFKRLRFDMKQIDKLGYSLFANLNALSRSEGMYIILVPKHVIAIEVTKDNQVWLVDNHSKEPLPAEGSARLSQRCEAIYKITERPQPKFLRTEIKISRDYSNWIYVTAYDFYENSDKVTRRLGQFTFKSEDEMNEILFQFTKEFQK